MDTAKLVRAILVIIMKSTLRSMEKLVEASNYTSQGNHADNTHFKGTLGIRPASTVPVSVPLAALTFLRALR